MLRFPFDPSFPSAAWEDIELAYRLDREGMKIIYNASAVTRHHHPMTVDSFSRRQYVVGKSGALFYRKYPELGHFLGVHELYEKGLTDDGQSEQTSRRSSSWGTIPIFCQEARSSEIFFASIIFAVSVTV